MPKKCRALSKLPKAHRFSSIKWKHQTPGSVSSALGGGHGNGFLDRGHPAARRPFRELPNLQRKELGARMIPVSLLEKPRDLLYPFQRHFLTWAERVQRAKEAGVTAVEKVKGQPMLVWTESGKPVGEMQIYTQADINGLPLPDCLTKPTGPLLKLAWKKAQRRIPMSYSTVTSKARMGSLRCTRRIITLRMKAALNMIVTRGAYFGDRATRDSGIVEEAPDVRDILSRSMMFDEEDVGRKWVMQGWSYIFSPTTHVYRMPYVKLIPLLRHTLTNLNRRALTLENQWLATSLLWEARNPQRPTFDKDTSKAVPGAYIQEKAESGAGRQWHPICLTTTKSPKSLHPPKPATAPRKLESTIDNAAWRRDLSAGMELLAQSFNYRLQDKTGSDKQA